MSNRKRLTPAERELELTLAALQPAPTRINRDKLMFLAGQKSARQRRWIWPAVAATLAVALTVSLSLRTRTIERIVTVPASQPQAEPVAAEVEPTTRPATEGVSYLAARQQVSEQGIEAMSAATPKTRPTPETQPSIGMFLLELLPQNGAPKK